MMILIGVALIAVPLLLGLLAALLNQDPPERQSIVFEEEEE